jgi:hypothetical protein
MARAPNVNQIFSEQFSFRAPVTPQRLAMPPQETLQSASVSWRDRLKDVISPIIGRHNAEMAMQVADFTPLGAVFAGNEARMAANRGGYGEAATGAALAALPIPAARGAGKVAREVAQEVPTVSTRALPMDEASRMARAREMGFTVDAYHGTTSPADITELGRTDRYGNRREVYLSPENAKDYASKYADNEGGRVMPLKVNDAGFLDTRKPKDLAAFKKIMDDKGYYAGIDWDFSKNADGEKVLPGWGKQNVIDAVNEAGYPGMVLQERPDMLSFAIFDPANIRSRFAAFDPAKRNSKNLMAGVAGAGVTGAATITTQSQRKDGGGI